MKILKVKLGQTVSIAHGKVFVTLHSIGRNAVRLAIDCDPFITVTVLKEDDPNN